jgi:hypothetical protein
MNGRTPSEAGSFSHSSPIEARNQSCGSGEFAATAEATIPDAPLKNAANSIGIRTPLA